MKSRVAELEAELEAAQRTIDALSDAMERGLSEASTDVPLTLQMLSLEQLVHERTHELASRQGELQAALDELGRTQAQLLSAQKLEAIGQLAAGIAHEINTPMQYIGDNTAFLQTAFTELLGYVARLEAAVGDTVKPSRKVEFVKERVGPAVDQTIEGVAAVSRLVQGMRSFAHPGSEEKEPTDINDSLETTVTVCRNEWKYVSEVELELEPGLPLVPALRAELNQVFLNMIVNSAQAIGEVVSGDEKGKIVVRTWSDEAAVYVSISDSGPGVPETLRSRVFDPFFTTKPVGKGTGQGLAIARSIVTEHHGGALELLATQPTTFLIKLPRGQSDLRTKTRPSMETMSAVGR